MKIRLLFFGGVLSLLFAGCALFHNELRSVKFRVIAKSTPPGSRIFITGEGDRLGNWKANAIALNPQSAGSWAKTIMLPAGKSFRFKVTRGSWLTEALDESGPQLRAEHQLKVVHDTTITLEFSKWMDTDGGTTVITAKDIGTVDGIRLFYGWRYHTGDDSSWSSYSFNDSSSEILKSNLDSDAMPMSGWKGIGWFRLNLEVDSSLWNKPLAMNLVEAGASEVYLDGKPLYSFGDVGRYFGKEKNFSENRNPNVISFGPGRHHVIAVRYAFSGALPAYAINYGLINGFAIRAANWDASINMAHDMDVRMATFATILGALAFIHFVLFLFYPKFKENLFYSLSTLGVGGVWLANNLSIYPVSESRIILLNHISQVSQFMAVIFGILLVGVFRTYSLTTGKFPSRLKVYVVLGILLAAWGAIDQSQLYVELNNTYTMVAMIEIAWMILASSKRGPVEGYLLATGFLVFTATVMYGILASYLNFPRLTATNDEYIYGVVALGIAMSIFLSHRFARTNQELEAKLEQVRELSEQTLAQERAAHEMEIDRRLLAADNERKTKELDDARDLQLSMLPKNLPRPPNLDISARMQTATEVGGDYYDFVASEDGTLTAVIGDATGHGLKAGNMVIAAKGLLNVLVPRNGNDTTMQLDEIMKISNRAIKSMNLRMLTMCLAIIRIKNHAVEYSSAGMPPLMIYRKQPGIVEQLTLKAMPLGAFYDFPYERTKTTVNEGDVILLVSDGVLELFNGGNESFGAERVAGYLKEVSYEAADEIIGHLFEKMKIWSDGTPLMDDVTTVAVKILS